MVEHQDKEKDQGTLHWVANGIKESAVKKFIQTLTGDKEAEVFQVKHCADMNPFLYKAGKNIPH